MKVSVLDHSEGESTYMALERRVDLRFMYPSSNSLECVPLTSAGGSNYLDHNSPAWYSRVLCLPYR